MDVSLNFAALDHIPLIEAGDDLVDVIVTGLERNAVRLVDGDILVLAQKIVSKAEGRIVDLSTVTPGDEAKEVAKAADKDPRLVEVILGESRSIIRQAPGVLITEHMRGWIMANAGIDASNVCGGTEDHVLLLPARPNRSCDELRTRLLERLGAKVGILINDSFGRPWRLGTCGVALGTAGIPSLWDRRGDKDMFGREMQVSQQAIADELASAASLLQGQGAEGKPIVLVRGFDTMLAASAPEVRATALIRPESEDLFR